MGKNGRTEGAFGFNSLADQGIFTHSVGDRVLS